MSKQDNDFYCLNGFYLFKTKNKLESHKRLFEKKNNVFCGVAMFSKDTKVKSR